MGGRILDRTGQSRPGHDPGEIRPDEGAAVAQKGCKRPLVTSLCGGGKSLFSVWPRAFLRVLSAGPVRVLDQLAELCSPPTAALIRKAR